jgi:hypothetical protein
MGMGSGAMTYIPSFIKISSGFKKLVREHTDTQTGWRSHTPVSGEQANKIEALKGYKLYIAHFHHFVNTDKHRALALLCQIVPFELLLN